MNEMKLVYRRYIYYAIISILILLWLYTVCDKLYDFASYKHSMYNQVFDASFASLLIYLLLALEWLAMCLLLFSNMRLAGLYLSALLLLAFTLYVACAVLGLYPEKPCSCGGLFRKLNWSSHLIVNCILTSLSLIGIVLHFNRKEVNGTSY